MEVTWSVKCSEKMGDSKATVTLTGILADKMYVDQINDLFKSWEKTARVDIDIEPIETKEQAKNQEKLFPETKEIVVKDVDLNELSV